MEYLLLLSLVALIVFPLQIPSTRALHNVTVDDLDPAVVYIGQWNLGTDEPLSYAGGHHSSSTPGGRATFTFIGVAVYYVSPLWSGYSPPVSTLLSLDGGEPVWVDLSSTSDEGYDIRWGISGLENGTHTLVTFIGTNSAGLEGTWSESDAFIYTVLDESDMSPEISPSIASSSVLSSALSVESSTPSRAIPSTSVTLPSQILSDSAMATPSEIPSSSDPLSLSILSSPTTSFLEPSSTPSLSTPSSSIIRPSSSSPSPVSSVSLSASLSPTHMLTFTPSISSLSPTNPLNLSLPDTIETSLELSPAQSTVPAVRGPVVSPLSNVLAGGERLPPFQKGGIVGASLTGSAVVVTVAVIVAANSGHLIYVIAPLAASLFGLVLFNCRKIYVVCNDPNLPELQISLFLTVDKTSNSDNHSDDPGSNRQLVWKVFSVGGHSKQLFLIVITHTSSADFMQAKDFEVTVPTATGRSKEAGQPKVGFGTIDDDDFDKRIRPQFWQPAPARLLEDGRWEHAAEEPGQQEGEFVAENSTGRNQRIAMGVSENAEDPGIGSFSPFLLINSKNFEPYGKFKVKSDIYIHAFRTGGCREGDYGDTVMKARRRDRLTPESGYRVKDFDPVTTFYVSCSGNNGEVKLVIGKNRPADVKRFRLEHATVFGFVRKFRGKKQSGGNTALFA